MMTRRTAVVLTLAAVLCAALSVSAIAAAFSPFYVYSNKDSKDNHFAPTGWMGDHKAVYFNDGWPTGSHTGPTCIKIRYKVTAAQDNGWSGIYWQHPPNNWGDKEDGFDLTGAKKLVLWVRGEKGGEVINAFIIGGTKGSYPDSTSVTVGPIDLTKEWQKIEINLEGEDLSHIIGGFGWSTSLASNPKGCTFYLDDIRYE